MGNEGIERLVHGVLAVSLDRQSGDDLRRFLVFFHEFLKLFSGFRADEMLCFAGIYLGLLRFNFKNVREEVVQDVLTHQHRSSHGLSLF
jgi:hypothetical protein